MKILSSLRISAIVAEILLIILGPVLVVVDCIHLSDWVVGSGLGDFYTYLALAGIISVLSIYGLIATFKKSIYHSSRYLRCLALILGIHFIIGWIHIILLFTTYQPIMMNTCLQRQQNRFFWWSNSLDLTDPNMQQVLEACLVQWNNFAVEKVVSWAIYSLVSLLCFCVIVKYNHRFKYEYTLAHSLIDAPDPCIAEGMTEKQPLEHHDDNDTKTAWTNAPNDSLAADMYQQRQKLYVEISKRRQARKNINRRSHIIGAASNRISTIHPLDFAQGNNKQVTEPAPTLSSDGFRPVYLEQDDPVTWYRPGVESNESIEQKEKNIERERRLGAISSERMEYEMYRSDHESRKGSVSSGSVYMGGRQHRPEVTGQSRRVRSKKNRWSNVYHNLSLEQTNNGEQCPNQDTEDSYAPLLNKNTKEGEEEKEEKKKEEEDREKQKDIQ